MWPKLIAQMVELLPHIARLVPMADAFFASRSAQQAAASEKATETTFVNLSEDVRADLGKLAAAQESLYRQMQEHGTQLSTIAGDTHRARMAVEGHADRITKLESAVSGLRIWLLITVVLLIVAVALLIFELAHQH
ncbi:MAG TPA: hypothetical protein VGC07_03215 [Granulicella sp.]